MFITKHLVKEKQYLSKKLVLLDRNRCIRKVYLCLYFLSRRCEMVREETQPRPLSVS